MATRGRRSPSRGGGGNGSRHGDSGGSPMKVLGQKATEGSEDLASPPNRARAQRTTAH
jgi:hypothetical protein